MGYRTIFLTGLRHLKPVLSRSAETTARKMSSNSEPAKLFSDQNKMYKQFGDQLGSVMASVETLSEAIVNSDTYPGDKKADVSAIPLHLSPSFPTFLSPSPAAED